MKKDVSQDTPLYIIGWIGILCLCGYFVLRNFFHIDLIDYTSGCVLNKLTGYYCPGCGGTRATFALLRGDIMRALYFHPFVVYVAVFGGWFMLSQTIERISHGKIQIAMHFRMVYVWIALILILGNFLIKNAILTFTGIPPM